MIKNATFKIKGMHQDLSESSFNSELAYENKNIRIAATNNNTTLSITNELGTKEHSVKGPNNTNLLIDGTPIGQATINKYYVLFVTNGNGEGYPDRIYRFHFEGELLHGVVLFQGNLNFNIDNPIEAIVSYENENVLKVYWVDGINQPRMINIVDDFTSYSAKTFDFTNDINLDATVNVSKNVNSTGQFAPGVIQYAFTYFKTNGLESNIFHVTPLYYTSHSDRGGSPEAKVNNSFNISVTNINIHNYSLFSHIRVYSIHRTSINSTPVVKVVSDAKITSKPGTPGIRYINLTDTGLIGYDVDPTILYYIGGESIIANTISHKDGTLFLGGITLKRPALTNTIKSYFKNSFNSVISFQLSDERITPNIVNKGHYAYTNLLKYPSSLITTFKYLEYYRFGLLFQHISGKWSEPIFLADKQNTASISYLTSNNFSGYPRKVIASLTTGLSLTIRDELTSLGYTKVRPVIVYPSLSDRSVICQGILNPTVYNVEDRSKNAPFAQSSWFIRPLAPFNKNSASGIKAEYFNRLGGTPPEFRHNTSIVTNGNIMTTLTPIDYVEGGEEISIVSPYYSTKPYYGSEGKMSFIEENNSNYFVDLSILTFHSPDLEFDDNLSNYDLSNLKLRIVGFVPYTANAYDIDIQTSTLPEELEQTGFYKSELILGELNKFGAKTVMADYFWYDITYNDDLVSYDKPLRGFKVYPWLREGSLNNAPKIENRPSVLSKKILSNLKYSYFTYYYNNVNIWEATNESNHGVSDIVLFNSNQSLIVKLKKPVNSLLGDDIVYYGNVDKLEIPNNLHSNPEIPSVTGVSQYITTEPVTVKGDGFNTDNKEPFTTFKSYYTTTNEPIKIKYKSSPHAVIALDYTSDGKLVVIPTTTDNSVRVNSAADNNGSNVFWTNLPVKVTQSSRDTPNILYSGDPNINNIGHGFSWMAELYRDDVAGRFGGTTEEAFENNEWLPAGKTVNLNGTILWTEGDTYFQRYDHLKTYPYTNEDTNQIVEIVSFMVETRVNIDGRYDRNRGLKSNLHINPTNFNLFNDVYSQRDNFFVYRGLNTTLSQVDYFPNTITWSLNKVAGELIDKWTNVNMAATLDLDGDKGELRAIRRFNNELIAFQDTGTSVILYNSRVLMPTVQGSPIELAVSGKVEGKRYISDTIGTTNKWSICKTPKGLYFIDSIDKSIQLFTGKDLTNISKALGFHSWMINKKLPLDAWNISNFNNAITYYDKINGEVHFITKDEDLVFSEDLELFTSFYSYHNAPYLTMIGNKLMWVNKARDCTQNLYKFWEHQAGEYSKFFGKTENFYTTLIVNPDPTVDKIFNTVEFRADSFNGSEYKSFDTFDKLDTWNEYQRGSATLNFSKNSSSNLKKKFKIWRANIPRDNMYVRDRMRNPWLYLKLTKSKNRHLRTVLHDVTVSYFE